MIEEFINKLKQELENKVIQYPTGDIHVGYNRAIGDVRVWVDSELKKVRGNENEWDTKYPK